MTGSGAPARMRIAFISIGGHIHTERWLRWFVERGHDVHLIAVDPVPLEGVTVHHLHTGIPFKPLHYAVGVIKLRRILARIRPDILHTHFLQGHGYWSIFAGVRPHVLTVWGDDVYAAPQRSRLRRLLSTLALRRADVVTGDSRDILRAVAALGADPARLERILWGVDFERFSPGDGARMRRAWAVAPDAPVILSPRSFSRGYYHIDVILDGFARARASVPGAVAVFAAYDGSGEDIERRASELGIAEAVRVVGRVDHDDMPDAYRAADVVVSVPSLDATSVSLLEAMACARAIVVSDLPSNREWIADGESGRVVPARDAAALADACTELFADAALRARLGGRALEVVRAEAGYRENMERMESICLDLVRRYRGAS